ncbi:MAG TPA: alpha/beta hydrolase [Thermoanaerobaculia bacterium]
MKLSGTLYLPERSTPAPAVVFLHGSGPQTRAGAAPIAQRFAEAGIAALVFDKRGCGASSGSWQAASLADLASDAVAAVRLLAARADLDRTKIGLWSISQSGWYAPIAANQEPAVSFVIVATGGGASPREVEWAGYERALSHRGIAGRDLDAARALVREYLEYLRTGEGRDELIRHIDNVKESAWYPALSLGRVLPSAETRPQWEWVAAYEPARDIETLAVPVLLLFGGKDPFTPASSLERWTTALARSSAATSTIRTFPEAGHGLIVGEHRSDVSAPPVYAVGYIETMIAWVNHVAAAPHAAPAAG